MVDGDPPPKSIEPDILLVLALMQQMAMMMRTKKTREIRTAPAAAMPMIVVIPSCGPEFKGDRKVLVSSRAAVHSHYFHSFYLTLRYLILMHKSITHQRAPSNTVLS